MGFWDRILGISSYDPAQRVLPDQYEPFFGTGGIPVMDPGSPLGYWTRTDVEQFWRTQPALRKVVGFVARNVASIPLHTHERVGDNDRRRITDHPLPRVLSRPQPYVGAFRFWESVIADGLLYDRWAVLKDWQDDGSLSLIQIPSWRLHFATDPLRRVIAARVWVGDSELLGSQEDGWAPLPLDDLVFDHGYAPRTAGLSPVETLKDLLDESTESVQYRRDVWRNGGHESKYIYRPKDAPWTPEQRNRFVEGLRKFLKGGPASGGTMLLEDGMEMRSAPLMKSSDAMDLEGRTLTATEVASAFFVAPELIGIREGNFSNIDAFRQSLYRDSLGPYITAWEQAVNIGLTDDLANGRNLYVEANVDAKLRGSFIEQAQVLQSATGAPWMARNEARSRLNMPPIDGGDELVTPLNVLIGGQASPRDSGSQNIASGPSRELKSTASVEYEIKAPTEVPEDHRKTMEDVFLAFFARQRRVVLSAAGAKSVEWWDAERWNRELAGDILAASLGVSKDAALSALDEMGVDPSEYNVDQTRAFLAAVAERIAAQVNAVTEAELAASGGVDEMAGVFDTAEGSRSEMAAMTAAATFVGFGMVEAARQTRPKARKRWVVNSKNPRSSHSAVNGEEVPIREKFSNGMDWPGSFTGDPADVANCYCSVVIIT